MGSLSQNRVIPSRRRVTKRRLLTGSIHPLQFWRCCVKVRVDPASAHQTDRHDSGRTAKVSLRRPGPVFGTSDTNESESRDDTEDIQVDCLPNERVRLGQLRMQDAAVRSQQFSKIAVAGGLAGSLNTQFTRSRWPALRHLGRCRRQHRPWKHARRDPGSSQYLRRVSSTSASVLTSNLVQDDVAIHAAQPSLQPAPRSMKKSQNSVVRAVEFDAEVTQRDFAAAAEAANWTAPPEFSAQNAVDPDDGPTTTDTVLAGAEVVTAPEQTESSQDESQRRAQFLALLKGDGPQPSQHQRSLDIVA